MILLYSLSGYNCKSCFSAKALFEHKIFATNIDSKRDSNPQYIDKIRTFLRVQEMSEMYGILMMSLWYSYPLENNVIRLLGIC